MFRQRDKKPRRISPLVSTRIDCVVSVTDLVGYQLANCSSEYYRYLSLLRAHDPASITSITATGVSTSQSKPLPISRVQLAHLATLRRLSPSPSLCRFPLSAICQGDIGREIHGIVSRDFEKSRGLCRQLELQQRPSLTHLAGNSLNRPQ
jgi:hypothetical protein